jgi:hypothetical protein
MSTEKLTQVTDYLHGSIPLTRLEKSVLSTEAFNRLHNVLQNSSAYLTYPSNRHSRFAHSVGVLHLAGEIFWSAFVNAKGEDQGRLLDGVQGELQELIANDAFRRDAEHLLHDYGVVEKLRSLSYEPIVEPVLRRRLAGGLVGSSAAAGFLALFQAIRLTGLLHDLGHPPFSHIVESALNTLLEGVERKSNEGRALTAREKSLLEILHFQPTERPAIHEPIGRRLAAHVLHQAVVRNLSPSKDQMLLSLVVMHLTLRILGKSSPFCAAVQAIVDGTLDADRLDYVARDALMTGFTDGGFRYARLLNSFTLRCTDADKRPHFLPSVQALSTIEDFFERRLGLYVFVVYHHRVVKTDGLLREAVVGLGKEYLSDTGEDSPLQGYALPTDISGLWRVLDKGLHISGTEIGNHYLQWDDAWLLTVLRKSYFSRQRPDDKELLDVQLEEFLSNRKHYYSLFKRPDSFASIDEAFLESLGGTFDLEPLRQEAEALSGGPSKPRRSGWHLYQAVEDYYSEVWPESGNADVRARAREAREKHGFFLINVFQALRFMQLSGMLMVRRAAKRLLTEWNLEDVFSVEKILRAGVDGDLELLRDDDIITLREVSEVVEQLERRIRLFPGFFVYVYRPQEISDQDLAAMRKQFAELLADEFRVIVAGLKRKEME